MVLVGHVNPERGAVGQWLDVLGRRGFLQSIASCFFCLHFSKVQERYLF